MCNDTGVIVEYGRKRSGLSNAPLDMEYGQDQDQDQDQDQISKAPLDKKHDNNSIEQSTAIALNIKHSPALRINILNIHIFTYRPSMLAASSLLL